MLHLLRGEGEALKGVTPSSSVSLAQRIDVSPNQTYIYYVSSYLTGSEVRLHYTDQ